MVDRIASSRLRYAARAAAALALIVAALCLGLCAQADRAYAKPYAGIAYKIDYSTHKVVFTGYDADYVAEHGKPSVIDIPETIEGCTDITIQYGAFRQNENLVKVTIAANVKAIPDVCFYKCPNLETVKLPDSVKSIGTVAFYGCTRLSDITLGTGLEELGKQAFFGCTSLEGITLPGSLASIGEQAFAGCMGLKSIEVPEGVGVLQKQAFMGCKALTSVTLNRGLKTIGESAFADCKGLAEVSIPESVTEIGDSAFRYSGLVKTNLPSGLTTLGVDAFGHCNKLADIGPIPESLTNIGAYAFSNCAFEYLALPDTITALPEGMFFACYKLKSIALPDALETIGMHAFASCHALEYLRVPGSVTFIGNNAFSDLQSAKMVYFENGDKNWAGGHVFGKSGSYEGKGLTVVCPVGIANASCKAEVLSLGATFKLLFETGTYLVKHDGNGDDGSIYMKDVTLPTGMAYALPPCYYAKDQADFKAWEGPGGEQYQPGQAMPASGSATMTAKALWDEWAESGYTVTFGPGSGGTGPSFAKVVKRGSSLELPASPFTPKPGFAFTGWKLIPTSVWSEAAWSPGAEIQPSTNITATAQWAGEYTITFNANGGTVSPSSMKTNGKGRLESWPSVSRPGYVLNCWSLSDDEADQVTLGRMYAENTKLNAVWEPVSSTTGGYLILFDANGGSLPSGEDSAFTDASGTLSSLPTPTRAGYEFEGWFRADMATKVTTSTEFAANEKVYAKWKESEPSSSSGDESGDSGGGALTPGVISGESSGPGESGSEPGASSGAPEGETAGIAMHRLYNPYTGEHFYTGSESERDDVVGAGWTYEGVGWTAPSTSSSPVYRVYNSYGGEHHYTMSASERDDLVGLGWTDEGTGWFSDDAEHTPLYRQYNPYMFSCNHNYTADTAERDSLVGLGWHDEGIAWYGL